MIPLDVVSGFLEMLFSLKISIFFKVTWTVLLPRVLFPLHKPSYQVFQIKPLLLGLIQLLYTTGGIHLPLQMALPLILHRHLVPPLLLSYVAPPELLDRLLGMALPILP